MGIKRLERGEIGGITFTGTGDKVYLSGSVLASTFQWTKGQNNIWSADVSSVMNKAPIFVTKRIVTENLYVFIKQKHQNTEWTHHGK